MPPVSRKRPQTAATSDDSSSGGETGGAKKKPKKDQQVIAMELTCITGGPKVTTFHKELFPLTIRIDTIPYNAALKIKSISQNNQCLLINAGLNHKSNLRDINHSIVEKLSATSLPPMLDNLYVKEGKSAMKSSKSGDDPFIGSFYQRNTLNLVKLGSDADLKAALDDKSYKI